MQTCLVCLTIDVGFPCRLLGVQCQFMTGGRQKISVIWMRSVRDL